VKLPGCRRGLGTLNATSGGARLGLAVTTVHERA
jgi:hypothetical protein